jgi:hypothetical protein
MSSAWKAAKALGSGVDSTPPGEMTSRMVS